MSSVLFCRTTIFVSTPPDEDYLHAASPDNEEWIGRYLHYHGIDTDATVSCISTSDLDAAMENYSTNTKP